MATNRLAYLVSIVLGAMVALSSFSQTGGARWAYLLLGLAVVAWAGLSLAGKKLP